jgi:hypothetical protein
MIRCFGGLRALPADDWIRNMPLEEQIGDAAGAVEAADTGIREWKTIMAAAKSAPPGAVLHTMTVSGGHPVNLGWVIPNRFGALGGPQDEASPSEVADNA